MAGNINRVIITGNLTRDPELGSLPQSGTAVCSLRIACNGRRKNNETGQWEDQPNYFDVTVWGQQGENCDRYLKKGRPVAVDGRLRWREWTTTEGQKRQAVDIIAETVQFLGGRDDAGNGNGFSSSVPATESDVPIDTGDFETAPVAAGAADDDIPF
jgi:single-strand DNA-binding protein